MSLNKKLKFHNHGFIQSGEDDSVKTVRCDNCKILLDKSSIKTHRSSCKKLPESKPINRNAAKACFVCDIQTSCSENLNKMKSQHSQTHVIKLIQQLLGDVKMHRNIEVELKTKCTARICTPCLLRINEYDLACLTAERVANELRAVILHTDSIYAANEKSDDTQNILNIKPELIESMQLDDEPRGGKDEIVDEQEFSKSTIDPLFSEGVKEEIDGEKIHTQTTLCSSLKCDDTKVKAKSKRVYECRHCPLKFELWKDFKNHKAEHRNEEARVRCNICNFNPKDDLALAEHKKMHIGLSPLQCVVCKKTFKHKRNINPHMRLHTGKKKYQCDRCGKEYFHKTSFSLHMAYHDGIRTVSCPHCEKQFFVKQDLEKHLITHTSEKPYSCEICGKRFARRDHMREHQRTHDKQQTEKQHFCPLCDAAFARRSKLNKHLDTHGVLGLDNKIKSSLYVDREENP